MPVKITCPHCEQPLRLPDALYEEPAQCPLCEGAFEAQWRARPEPLPAPAPPVDDSAVRQPCPRCGEPILKTAAKCRHCREWLRDKPASSR